MLKYVGDDKKASWGRHWIEHGFNGECSDDEITIVCFPLPRVMGGKENFANEAIVLFRSGEAVDEDIWQVLCWG